MLDIGVIQGRGFRNVVEGGQMLAQGLVAVSKMLPRQHVTSATMYFPKAAAFDAPLDVDVDLSVAGARELAAAVLAAAELAECTAGTVSNLPPS